MENPGESYENVDDLGVPSGKWLTVCYWKLPLEIVDLSIKNSDFPLC